jgi:putative DNA primase/helicase
MSERDWNDISRADGPASLRDFIDATAQPPKPDLTKVFRPPELSDDALALEFAGRHGNKLRYVAERSKWLTWDGSVWREDKTYFVFDLARQLCREVASKLDNNKMARSIASSETIAAVERLARSDREIAATIDQWDADPWILNTPGEAIDLRNGKGRRASAKDYLAKSTAVSRGAGCPTWLGFLERITGGDDELTSYLKRVSGYVLTGSTQEQVFFFGYGTGGNGKGTFVDTLAGILADYHSSAPIETFTASRTERHLTELADLAGARFVTATETEESKAWAESRLKMLTGGDRVKARFMRQNLFEFSPQFKLLMTGNHKPRLQSVDEAIRRRLHLIPFLVTIPAGERDQRLRETLRREWPGILGWMVEGCLEWQQSGLAPPSSVQDATASYMEAQDSFGAWVDEFTERDVNAWQRSVDLFASWKAYASRTGDEVGDTKRFRERLEARGYRHHPQAGTNRAGYKGLRLRAFEESDDRQ